MTEKEQIINNIKGEVPNKEYDTLIIKSISNPSGDLQVFKDCILTMLNYPTLDDEDPQWQKILPKKFVAFSNQLTEDDYDNDDLLHEIPSMIYKFRQIRDWEWYSSKVTNDGFEVIVTGRFMAIFLPLIHHIGIKLSSIFILSGGRLFPTRVYKDVLSYRNFDPVTLILK